MKYSLHGIRRRTSLEGYRGSGKLGSECKEQILANRTIINWNRLPAHLLASFPCNLNTFGKSVVIKVVVIVFILCSHLVYSMSSSVFCFSKLT
jgi:hypothetical protein